MATTTEPATTASSDTATTASKPTLTLTSNSTSTPRSDDLPSAETITKLNNLAVQDQNKQSIKFSDLITPTDSHTRTIVVFIRHFFCGNCQQYLLALSQTLPPAVLAKQSPRTNLIVIGHGDPALIPQYLKETNCPYTIYADPSRKVYDTLGFVSNIKGGDTKPEYMTQSFVSNFFSSLRQNLSAGKNALGGGKLSQNGGEGVWIGGELRWLNRMRNTEDHVAVKDLEAVLGGLGD